MSVLCLARQAGRLSGLTRGFATAPATTRDVFDSFEELVTTDDGRRELERVRSMYRQMDHEAEEQAKEVPKINFANQFKDLDPDVAKAFQAAQDGMKFEPYDFAKDRQEIRDLFGPLIKQAEEMATHAEKRLVEIRKEMKRLEEEKARISLTTIDEEMAADPELAKRVDKEIVEQNYMIT